jgi:hypothetical protein
MTMDKDRAAGREGALPEPYHVELRANAHAEVCDANGRAFVTCSWTTEAHERAELVCRLLNEHACRHQDATSALNRGEDVKRSMTPDKELIERLAREAHDAWYWVGRAIPPDWAALDRFDRERWVAMVRHFAPFVAEECAKVCDERAEMQAPAKLDGIELMKWLDRRASDAACAAAIREKFRSKP